MAKEKEKVMGKKELVDYAAAKAGITKADATRALDAFLEGIVSGLKKGERITLLGFGSFTASVRPAHDGFNPLTKEKIHIEEKTAVSFKPSLALKKDVNEK